MPEYIVKYKLEKTDIGYTSPEIIYDGGYVWSNEGKVEDMILVGKANFKVTEGTPDCVIERITKQQWDDHKNGRTDDSLKKFKAEMYERTADKLFQEAYREKELGRPDKWNRYLEICNDIYNLTEIPSEGII